MILIIVAVVLLVVIFSWAYILNDSKRLNVLGPFPLPLVGNALMFLGDAEDFLNLMVNLNVVYGDIARAYIGFARYVLVAHPKYIAPICSSTQFITKGNAYDCLKPWLGNGLLTSSGRRWQLHRKLLTPAFHFNVSQSFLPVFCKTERILVKKLLNLANGQPFDLFPVIALAALDNVTESIMGVSINAQEDDHSDYVKAVEVMSKIASSRMRNPFIWNDFCYNLVYKKQQDKALGVLHGQTKKVIAARRQELEVNGVSSLPSESELGIKNKHAFLDLLLLSASEGEKIDDESIREEVDTFMFEGHDTTTSGLVFCLYCLANNEEVQNKAFQEQERVFYDDLKREITFSDLQQMHYLEQVIKETLRLYPSVPLIERTMTQDSKVGDVIIPKNTAVVINILQMQRHPDVHEDPLAFRPERIESGGNRPFDWMFFSAGPRNCIGQKFAMMEMKVTLSAIIRNFKLVPSNKKPILIADLILRSKNGVHVGFLPRS